MRPILSIVIPFYNSAKKCDRLLRTLLDLSDSEVEVICVDDGSADSTPQLLENFKFEASIRVKVITQENRGPGGARNAGIDQASGEYIWLVDSDDDILVCNALKLLRAVYSKSYDIIDFNLVSKSLIINSMSVPEGEITSKDEDLAKILLDKFGRICTKLFHSRIFKYCLIRYPEYCIYEDNPLQFIIPFYVDSLYKSEEALYVHHEEFESITRSKLSSRYYDRMLTSVWGYEKGVHLSDGNVEYIEIMKNKFVQLYFFNTGRLSRIPDYSWIDKIRIINQFNRECRRLKIEVHLTKIFKAKNVRFKLRMKLRFLWLASLLIPSQKKYFDRKRIDAWGRPFEAPF